jgi:ribosomal-protein-alanine N-acetyltransferase
MQTAAILETARLILRPWRDADRGPFAAINADPRVMECMPHCLTVEESDGLVDEFEAHFREHGFGRCAVELLPDGVFIGYIGLAIPEFQAHFTPCVEISWRLAAKYWNRGLATEGARSVIDYAFGTLGLEEIVSFTIPSNLPSRRVMEKLGMTHHPRDDFDHPKLPLGHPMRRHVLYRLARPHQTEQKTGPL